MPAQSVSGAKGSERFLHWQLTQSIANLGSATVGVAAPGGAAIARLAAAGVDSAVGFFSYKIKYDEKTQPQDLRQDVNRNLRANLLIRATSGKVVPGLVSDDMKPPVNAVEKRIQADRRAWGQMFSSKVVGIWCFLSGSEFRDPILSEQIAGEVVLERLEENLQNPAPAGSGFAGRG